MDSICGIDCGQCELRNSCCGCAKTNGRPFGGECVVATCCISKGCENCGKYLNAPCKLKKELIAEFNALGICDMEEITDLNALLGSYANVEYFFPNGQKVKLLDDNNIYLGNQVCKKDSSRCYGLVGDNNYLMVCEYGANGTDAEIVVYKKRLKL